MRARLLLREIRAAEGVVTNASCLLAGRDPKEVMEELVAYRGMTAAAIDMMIKTGFINAVHAGLAAAAHKAAAMTRTDA